MPDDLLTVRTNLPDFKRGLDRLARAVRLRIVRRALRQTANVARDVARQMAPVLKTRASRRLPGALRRSIYVARDRKLSDAGQEVFFVGVRGRRNTKRSGTIDAFYWRFLEGGWLPRGPGKRLRGGRRARALRRARAVGARRQYPFIAPAAARAQSAMIARFNRVMTDGLLDEARKP